MTLQLLAPEQAQALDAGEEIEVTLPLSSLGALVENHALKVQVSSPDGYVPVTAFLHHGERPCVKVDFNDGSSTECSIDHKIQLAVYAVDDNPEGDIKVCAANLEKVTWEGDVPWIEAQYLEAGDELVGECSHQILVLGLSHTGVKEVYDLSVDHDASNGAHRFFADGKSVHNCVNCGACDSFTEVKAITRQDGREFGERDFWRIKDVTRDSEPHQKLLIEVRVDGGVYSAIPTKWFRYAVGRAIARASNHLSKEHVTFEMVEPFISQRFVHSRQGYRLKSETFKDMLSGSLLIEFSYNSLINMDQNYVDKLFARIHQFTTPGWRIANIILKDKDFILRNNLEYALTTYRFDTRKVNPDLCDLGYLQERIENFFSKDSSIKYRSQHAQGRFATRTEVKDYDKTKVIFMSAGIGRNRYESVLRVISKVEDSHPLLFLAGFLGGSSGPKAYTGLYGVQVNMDGFYKRASQGVNLFDVLGGGDDSDVKDTTHSTTCISCGNQKLINLVTGLPFGQANYEQDPLLMRKFEGEPVCQECFSSAAP